jgi:peroxiredoxin Q/BCP
MTVEIGKKAPQFTLASSTGTKVKLADFLGKTVVLYFYPKDDTPGCTTQACDFKDNLGRLQSNNISVIGISPDSPESHAKFTEKYNLPFTLLCDPDKKIAEKYGAYGEKKMYGKTTVGIIRSTFIIDPQGKIQNIFSNVRAKGHVDKLLKELNV